MLNARRTCRIIGSCSIKHFHTFKSIGNNSKERKLGTVWIEVKRPRRFLWTIAPTAKTERFFLHIVTNDEKWMHYDNPKRKKSWDKPGHARPSHQHPRQSRISIVPSICFIFGSIVTKATKTEKSRLIWLADLVTGRIRFWREVLSWGPPAY